MTNSVRSLSPPPLASLLDAGRPALFLDFDGTLVEIANSPDDIRVANELGSRLEALADRLGGALAVISGRSIDNILQFIGPVRLFLAGSHGAHVREPTGSTLREVQALPKEVQGDLAAFAGKSGLLYEPKSHGAALHYRSRPELADTARAFARRLALQNGLGIKEGKCVIEIVRPGFDKGGAVRLLSEGQMFAGRTPIFIGDDLTDEDGFVACKELGGFGIIVGNRTETAASYRLGTVAEVYQWLSL